MRRVRTRAQPLLGAVAVATIGLCAHSVQADEPRFALSLVPAPLPTGVSAKELREALTAAAAAWSHPAIACSSLVVTVGQDATGRLVEADGVSKVFFRTRRWCHNERCGGLRTFPLAAAAMTTRQRSPHLEADIEINGVSYAWGERASDSSKRHVSLRTVLVHEIGHALGLEDACASKHGQPLTIGCAETHTVMYAPALFDRPQEIDVARICRKFPRSLPRRSSTGRETATTMGRGLLPWLLLATLLLFVHVRGHGRGPA
jgi:hypothetical protein